MEAMLKLFEKRINDLRKLEVDIDVAIVNKKVKDQKSEKVSQEKKDQGRKNFKSMKQLTVIRKTKEDVIQAQADPDTTFVLDKIKEIFS